MKLSIAATLIVQAFGALASTNVVCEGFDGATVWDAQWAALNRKAELQLGPKGFWNGRIVNCKDGGGNNRQVFGFCRSDGYNTAQTTLKNGLVVCAANPWAGCNVC